MRSLRLSHDPQLKRAESSNPRPSQGATGSGVAILQDLLADMGFKFARTFAHGRGDGIFGPETLAVSSSRLRWPGRSMALWVREH